LLDSTTYEWRHPPVKSKSGEKEQARRRRPKAENNDIVSDSLLPCARFGHSAGVYEQRLLIFGGADFKGPLGVRVLSESDE